MEPKEKAAFIEFYRKRITQPWPPWVRKLLARWARVLLPALNESELAWTIDTIITDPLLVIEAQPELLARITGNLSAWLYTVRDQLPEILKLDPQWEVTIAPNLTQIETAVREWLLFRPNVTYQDQKLILAAFTKAFDRTANELGQSLGGTPYVRADFFILFYWPFVERMRSVGDLYRFLVMQTGEGHRVGTQKRVEKLCADIGLRFKRLELSSRPLLPPSQHE